MSQIFRSLILPVVTGLAVWSATVWWINSHPETDIYYEIRTRSIPARAEMKFDTFSEVTLWNPSRRVPATNIHLSMSLPTTSAPEIGHVATPEDPNRYTLKVSEPDSGSVGIAFRAARLAPGSEVTLPVWWRASATKEVHLDGAADQCVLAPGQRERTHSPGVWPALATVLAAALIFPLWFKLRIRDIARRTTLPQDTPGVRFVVEKDGSLRVVRDSPDGSSD